MAIYPDKKNGKLTGRFRVELQRGQKRYRKRWDTYGEAETDEKAVLAHWDSGEALPAPGEAPGAPEVHTLASVIPLAKGNLWDGMDTENLCFQRMEIIAQHMGHHTRLDAIDTHMVDQLIKKLRAAKRSGGTINRYLSILHTFLLWARTRKYRTVPVDGEEGISFSWKKETRGRIRWITPKEEKALEQFLTSQTGPKAAEALAVWKVIQIALATGCRRDELLTATLDQINGDRIHLWKTKTDSARTVPLAPPIRDMLRYLLQSQTMPTHWGLRVWWEKARQHMGLADDPDFVFHACRHTCATRMVDADVNIFVIKEWMGHKVMETTLRYAHVKPQNLTDALKKVGDHLRLVASNPSISVLSAPPLPSPTGGEVATFGAAA